MFVVPPFFIPLYASSIGLSSLTGSLLLGQWARLFHSCSCVLTEACGSLAAGFNLASAAGRICCGLGADVMLGSVNAMVLCLAVCGFSTFVIWPVATTLPPLYDNHAHFCPNCYLRLTSTLR